MLKTKSGQFSKMEQVERMQQKYSAIALNAELNGDYDKMDKYENMADTLQNAIANIRYNQATKRDWQIFNQAVAQRDLLDVGIQTKRDIKKALR